MVRGARIGEEAAIEKGVPKLNKRFFPVKVRTPQHYCSAFVRWFDNYVTVATQVSKGSRFNRYDIRMG